jgi:hypothetical protein
MKTLYLNNSGSRWVMYDKRHRKVQIMFDYQGDVFTRTSLYFKQWGNFTFALVSLKGHKVKISEFMLIEDMRYDSL